MNVHIFKFTTHLVLGAPLTLLVIGCNLVFGFINLPEFKVGKYINMTIVGVLFKLLVRVWVIFTCPTWTVAITDNLSFSNLYRQVVTKIIMASLGSVLVHFF